MNKILASFIKFTSCRYILYQYKIRKIFQIQTKILFYAILFIPYYGCISYSAKNAENAEIGSVISSNQLELTSSKSTSFKNPQPMSYFIANGTMFFGKEKLEEILNTSGYFLSPKKAFDPVQNELFLRINITSKNPETLVIFLHYISLYFYTILPAWTSNSGYTVEFLAIKNDKTILKKEYEIFRKSFIWILILPVSWVNFFTTHESEVFEYITTDFLKELVEMEN